MTPQLKEEAAILVERLAWARAKGFEASFEIAQRELEELLDVIRNPQPNFPWLVEDKYDA